MAARLVVDGTMRRIGDPGARSVSTLSGVESAAEFFRFVALRAGLPLERTADVLIADYAMVLGFEGLMHDEELNGLDAKELAALTRVECGKGLPVDHIDCPVCFATLAEVPATILPCSHAFCEDCTVRWMATHTTCPMCRLDCRFVNGFAPFKPRRQRAVPTGQIAPLAAPTTSSAAPASGLAAPLVPGVGAAPVLADVASPEPTTVLELAPPQLSPEPQWPTMPGTTSTVASPRRGSRRPVASPPAARPRAPPPPPRSHYRPAPPHEHRGL